MHPGAVNVRRMLERYELRGAAEIGKAELMKRIYEIPHLRRQATRAKVVPGGVVRRRGGNAAKSINLVANAIDHAYLQIICLLSWID